MRFRLSFPGYCTPWQTTDKTVVMVIYSQNVKLMGEQKAEKCLNLQATIYRYILSKEKTLFLLPASTLICVLDPMT